MATWDPLTVGVTSGGDADLRLQQRTLELRYHFASATPPTVVDPDDIGTIYLDISTTPPVLKLYADLDGGGAAWHALGVLSRIAAAMNMDPDLADGRAAPYQIKGLRAENVAALVAAAAGNAGMLQFLTTNGELYVSDQPVAGGHKGLLSVTLLASYDTQELDLQGDVGNDAVNPPTRALSGVLDGWKFDAINEKRTLAFIVPKNWQGATDVKLRLHQVLVAAQTASDVIEWSGEVRVLPLATAKTGKAATALVDASTNIGANADGIDAGGGPHVTTLNLVYNDETNPLSVGALVLVTVWRKTVSGAGKAAGTLVFRADLAYAQKPRHERA